MVLVDTSVWVEVLRDRRSEKLESLRAALGGDEVVLSRFTQLELLQGCRDEREWSLLASYLEGQEYLELTEVSWPAAARIFFDLRRAGRTVRSPIDCCIAQLALENDLLLLHRDGDFETIATARRLRHQWLRWG